LDLFDNGISANVVLFIDRWKMQIPKWVMRDFLSLGAVMYPDAPLNRRENPEHVSVEEVMTARLAAAGFRYNPGNAHTYLPDAGADPGAVLEHTSRADLTRAGKPSEMYKVILADVAAAERGGADLSKWSGVQKLIDDYGWTGFEVLAVRELRRTYRERNALRNHVKELEAKG
jgi:hypothetical protein